ncbi:hypothetical protein FACS189427_11170 [Planctomycetales bacterium]|nr:hypothetical protein FACS189427_11170 [Planctomycetales bacterium]
MLKQNLHYFRTSVNTPEISDDCYKFLDWDKDLDEYVAVTNQLKVYLGTIKTLRITGQDTEPTYRLMFDLFRNADGFAYKSEFSCFAIACDETVETLKKNKNYTAFKEVVDLFLLHRNSEAITSREWVQALIDSGASRKKGVTGENKLIDIAMQNGFQLIADWDNFMQTSKCVTKFSNGQFDLPNVKKQLGITLKGSQNKKMDLIIRNNSNFMFIEAKHLKQTGNSQNNQLKELIEILQQSPKTTGKEIYVGSFLDGVYSNTVLNLTEQNIADSSTLSGSSRDTKLITQQKEIIEALYNNPNSFWFNTAGFTEWIKDFAENSRK